VPRDALVPAGFLAGALALTVLVVRDRREWTFSQLKPALSS
jgi:hypothetical protein